MLGTICCFGIPYFIQSSKFGQEGFSSFIRKARATCFKAAKVQSYELVANIVVFWYLILLIVTGC